MEVIYFKTIFVVELFDIKATDRAEEIIVRISRAVTVRANLHYFSDCQSVSDGTGNWASVAATCLVAEGRLFNLKTLNNKI